MLLAGVFVLAGFLTSGCRADAPLECNIISLKSPTLRLKRHLFCEYDSSIRPVTNKNTAINVTVSLSPRFMDFVDQTSSFILHTWAFIGWNDEHLTWKPEDFDGVNRLQVKSNEIWVPDFSIYNSGDMEAEQSGVPETMCELSNTGRILCVPTIKYTSQCDTDFTYWPYDEQTCSLRLGSWVHTGEEISFDFRKPAIILNNYIPHKEWLITNYTSRKNNPKFKCCPNDTFPTLIATFSLQRHSPMIRAAFITPIVVMIIITLTVLWLDSRTIERISLAAVNFICHILSICDLHWSLPSNGANPPHILLFYRDSIMLAGLAMIVTAISRKLQDTIVPPPTWIVSTVSFFTSNRAGRLLLVNEADSKGLISSDVEENTDPISNAALGKDNIWRKFAVIVEWLTFLFALFTYVMLFFLRVPMSDD